MKNTKNSLPKYSVKLVQEKRLQYTITEQTETTKNAQDLIKLFRAFTTPEPQEVVSMIAFDAKLKPIGYFEISRGSITSSIINPRDALMRLLLCNAYAFALCHNHPSGDPTPSTQDVQMSELLEKIADLMQLNMLDHVILGHNRSYSIKERRYYHI